MRLVGQRPDDHARVAVVIIHHRRRGRERGKEIRRVVQRAADPAERRLDLHVHPQPVGGVEQLGGRRVVRGADVVQVRLLQQADIRLGVAHGVGAAGERVHLMVAGARQLHALAVDIDLPAPDLDVAEADVPLDALQRRPAPPQLHRQPVKLRLLRAPLQRPGNVRDEVNGFRAGERLNGRSGKRVLDHLAGRVPQREHERQRFGRASVLASPVVCGCLGSRGRSPSLIRPALHHQVQPYLPIPVILIERRVDVHLPHMRRRQRKHPHRTVNAAEVMERVSRTK